MAHLQPPVMPPPKRKPDGSDLNEPAHKRPAIGPVDLQPAASYHHARIQPRPSRNGYPVPAPPVPSPTVPQATIGRKRGRPSKADKEAQARANAHNSLSHILAPLAPHPPPSMPRDQSPNAPVLYRVAASPMDPRPRKRGSLPLSADMTQPVSSEPP